MPRKGYKQIKNHSRKIGLANTGKKRTFTKEWKQNISKGKNGIARQEETKRKISKAMKGRKLTKEHTRRIGKAKRELYSNPKNHPSYKDGNSLKKHYCLNCKKEISVYAKRCNSCSTKKKWQTNNYRNKMITIMNTHSYKEKLRKGHRKQWKDGKMDGVFVSPTKPEKTIMQVLKNISIDYIFQYRPKNYSMTYDFYVPDINLLIEFDGIYWHSLLKVKKRDTEKTQYAKNNGYNLLRINEHNLNDFKSIILKRKDTIINLIS